MSFNFLTNGFDRDDTAAGPSIPDRTRTAPLLRLRDSLDPQRVLDSIAAADQRAAEGFRIVDD